MTDLVFDPIANPPANGGYDSGGGYTPANNQREAFMEALIGGGLYREAFASRRAQNNPRDIDRWIRQEVYSLRANKEHRRVLGRLMTFGSPEPPPTVTVERAESMFGWPIYRAALCR